MDPVKHDDDRVVDSTHTLDQRIQHSMTPSIPEAPHMMMVSSPMPNMHGMLNFGVGNLMNPVNSIRADDSRNIEIVLPSLPSSLLTTFDEEKEQKKPKKSVKRKREPAEGNTYSCKLCSFTTDTKSQLTRHSQMHSNEKPFACNLCSYRCVQRAHLNRHTRTHTGDKPYRCTYGDCKYRCSEKSDLTKHKKTHSFEKPYSCPHCMYACAVKSYLTKHMRTHANNIHFTQARTPKPATTTPSQVETTITPLS